MPTIRGSTEATSKARSIWAKTCCGGEGAEYLVEEADLDRAGRPCAGLAAVFDGVASVESVIQLFAVDCNFVSKATGKEGVAEMAEVFASGAGRVATAV